MGLPPELADRVLAKVGNRDIVLRDYAAALERMGKLEALRYQTDDRRGDLLDELVNVELLAREAERRGLDRAPRTQALVLQMLKAEALRLLDQSSPSPDSPSPQQLRAYYAAHRSDFFQPERRRLSVLLFPSRQSAEQGLKRVRGGSMGAWLELARQLDPQAAPPPNRYVAELLTVPGDLGMVRAGPVGSEPDNPQVPAALRDAAFEMKEPSTVLGRVVELSDADSAAVGDSAGSYGAQSYGAQSRGALGHGRFALVRWVSQVPAHDPPFEEVRTQVAARLFQQQQAKARRSLLERLRQEIPVQYDRDALRDAGIEIMEGL